MSLDPRDSQRRGRSRSPGRERSRSRDDRDRSQVRGERVERVTRIERAPSPPSYYESKRHDYDDHASRDQYTTGSSHRSKSPLPSSRPSYAVPGSYSEEDVKVRYGEREKDYHVDTYKSSSSRRDSDRTRERDRGREKERDRERELERDREEARRYAERERERSASFALSAGHHSISGGVNVEHDSHSSSYYAPYPEERHYGKAEETVTYSKRHEYRPPSPHRYGSHYDPHDPARVSASQLVTVRPSQHRRDSSPNPSSLAPRMHSLSVSTGSHGGSQLSLANAPGSPLLEAYHGTYQSISPMPSPLLMAAAPVAGLEIVEGLSPLSSDDERRGSKKSRKSARFHDSVEEAKSIATALKGERAPDTEPLIEILPGLTHEQVLELRVQYKLIVKTGHERKGVNVAKHIKLRLKDEDPSLMKACYTCALGKWESEAYWANFWYQGEKSRRELLIESLMGRTNAEIREIKEGFSDKKYHDSLTKCMKTELKEDKFKKAILLVLEEKRMEDHPNHLNNDLVLDDVKDLHKAVKSEKGGESAMINIVVVRSDSHLREVLRVYERKYDTNFAREMLKRSGNLVGELLAHILNGVINKPVRDALLVHHALSLSKSDSLKNELLTSRLVRYHWDRPHMELIKREYKNRYGVDMATAVAENTKGEWGRFCQVLCVRRMGDEVREVSRRGEYITY